MSETTPGARIDVADEAALGQILESSGIPVEQWGVGPAKTVGHLLKEVAAGETTLSYDEEGNLRRLVNVAWVDVYAHDQQGAPLHLVEDRQEFRNGHVKRRALMASLGEKMLPGEHALDAAQRALGEELGVENPSSLRYIGRETTTHTPDTYPGLQSRFVNHTVITEIPPSAFQPDGYVEEQPDKTSYFVWQPVVDGLRP